MLLEKYLAFIGCDYPSNPELQSVLHGALWYTPGFLCYARFFFCHFVQNLLNQREAVVPAYRKICQLEIYFISMEEEGQEKFI